VLNKESDPGLLCRSAQVARNNEPRARLVGKLSLTAACGTKKPASQRVPSKHGPVGVSSTRRAEATPVISRSDLFTHILHKSESELPPV